MRNTIYRILDHPWVYKLQESILAPGAGKNIVNIISLVLDQLPKAQRVLDIGCGPSSWLWKLGTYPVGLDISQIYARKYYQKDGDVVVASAAYVPFPDNYFEGVFSLGLLHHVSFAIASEIISECIRVCRTGGYITIFDNLLPEFKHRPFPFLLRKMDRGKFVRDERHLNALFPSVYRWTKQRKTYTPTGLEMMVYWMIKE